MIDEIRSIAKKSKITNFLLNVAKYIYYPLYTRINKNKYVALRKELNSYKIMNTYQTAYKLSHSNMSLGRFGDGDISITLNKNNGIDNVEKRSSTISSSLIDVLRNKNKNFMIGLPDAFKSLKNYTKKSQWYWNRFIVNYGKSFLSYLNINKHYYNTAVTRPYIDYANRNNSGLIFYLMKSIWKNKNVLIIEGTKSRVGVGDDLLDNSNNVKRIECPSTNAFESYEDILNHSITFLKNHHDYVSLLSLGPTATILSLSLCNHGFRAIDIGNLDLEYQWYLLNVKGRVNLPYKYVTEVPHGNNVLPVNNTSYNKQIICNINKNKDM